MMLQEKTILVTGGGGGIGEGVARVCHREVRMSSLAT